MDDQEEDNPSPFWLQNTSPRHCLRRRDSFSLIFNSGFILIFLLAIAFLLIFVIVPSFLSFTAKIVKPHLVKRSWDSLNLVLVLFAIVCAFLSKTSNSNTSSGSGRTNDNHFAASSSSSSYYGDRNIYSQTKNEAQKSNPSTPQSNDRWYDFPDRTAYNKLNRLRSGRSYPDLRQESSWVTGDERWRFYDDTFVSQRSDQWLPESQEVRDNRTGSTKEVEVDNSASITRQKEVSLPPRTSPRPAPEPLPPPPLAPAVATQSSQQQPPQSSQALLSKAVRRKAKRRHTEEDNGGEGGSKNMDAEVKNVIYRPQPSPAAPPSPPPPPPVFSTSGKKRGKDLLISLRRRKKKQRQKSVENLESLFDPQPHNLYSQPPPSAPPPPPPPPPAFLQGLFSSKKGKAKKVHSVSAASPPPPPPPPARVSRNVYHSAQSLEASALSPTKAQSAQAAAHKAPKPVKTSISNSAADDNVDSGNASPLIPIPPPPPPPPFKMPVWRYVVEGDYVRLKSISRSASPELEDPSDKESSPSAMDGTSSPLFCPSPDVNTKADNFIARFKETLRLEKAKSINDRRRSNLGPETTQGPAKEGPS
ncbi:hypothetical protein HS088_TW07G01125 [Tripterygium wilfordii]|uniref:Hydroxyproline-rich glycoprotein family protein n=1 Tax=Tripterygium wilfordii TaxID=458696 RepID=A0A7J7DH13_TRIWF|nr:pollen-specific leucine-rich repeat extensin-like protein 1 [Tripterygium wilfordii]KAF5745534.1 hypothetical protein HS088_TW07G01125 [Tripterygium wilfordii]